MKVLLSAKDLWEIITGAETLNGRLLQKSREIINERESGLRYNLFVCFYKSSNLCEKCRKGLGQSFEAF